MFFEVFRRQSGPPFVSFVYFVVNPPVKLKMPQFGMAWHELHRHLPCTAAMSSTTRLPNALLIRANRFLLALYESADLAHLRSVIPHGLGQLIRADRVSLNFVGAVLPGQTTVVPANVPRYWSRLREVYCKHFHEHVLNLHSHRLHRVAGLTDWRNDLVWEKSALYNEYYRPIGCRQQIGVNVFRTDQDFVNIGFNRESRDFRAEDRGVLQLLSPHIGSALHRARQLDPTLWPGVCSPSESSPGKAVIELDRPTGRVTRLSPTAAAMILRHTGVALGEGRSLPDLIHRWLAAQRRSLASADDLGHLPEPLVLHAADRSLIVSLRQTSPETTTLLLRETPELHASGVTVNGRLTPREQEVLDWIAEGKRNCEIASITGTSVRTVEKHVEHIFEKLGTETRTAAMLRAMEMRPHVRS